MIEKQKIMLLGNLGQLGKEFSRAFAMRGVRFFGSDVPGCDISDIDALSKLVKEVKPTLVINCAAYNFVDQAEIDSADAMRVNAIAPKNLAELSREYGFLPVHFSSDYVFDGNIQSGLYSELHTPNPINNYGVSKLRGEEFLAEADEYLIFRLSWIYGDGSQNFINKLVQWTKSSAPLRISCDEYSVPTSCKTIVDYVLLALERNLRGTYHLTNNGFASRLEWARAILDICSIPKKIYPARMAEFELPAARPFFSAMNPDKLEMDCGTSIPHWRDSLSEFISNGGLDAYLTK